MKKAILSIAVLSALGFSTVSEAAYSLGPSGTITFNGGLNAVTCSVTDAGATVSGNNLTYNMGTVSTNDIGTEAAPTTVASGGGAASAFTAMNLLLACTNSTSVQLTLTPTTRSGRGIAVTGGAANVQIMLVQGTTALDFSGGSVTLAPRTLSGGFVMEPLKAYYTLQAGKTTSDVTSGAANGSATYVLSYN
ncbi:hypothetical protein DJFAAGMI_03837 [Comamonas sp. PE63]|uniref:Type 1 fimbrial protein n=1 Tax=Comamonas brasiliensis TaxID=1812482 RepID=A0ABS5LX38_9BURK|nr:type 1 fimbrial protein [Comamonas sp. PE63]MBS3021073.1 hypothetical protein [Comamonas sp. PE63]